MKAGQGWISFFAALGFIAGSHCASAQPAPEQAPAKEKLIDICPNALHVLRAMRNPVEAMKAHQLRLGSALIQITVAPEDVISDVAVVESTHPIFAEAALQSARKLTCVGGGQERRLRIPFTYEWSP